MRNEATQVAVTAPGLPGVTVVETDVARPAQREVVLPQSSVEGMSETQAQAIRWMDQNRARYLNASGQEKHVLARQWREAQEHAFQGGAMPAHLKAIDPQAQRDAQARTSQAESDPMADELAPGFDPVDASQAEQLAARLKSLGASDDLAHTVADFAYALEIPPAVANVIGDRALHHHRHGWDTEMSEADHAELFAECARSYGTEEKAVQAAELARKYLEHVGGEKALAFVDKYCESLSYDPRVLNALGMLARARGLS